MYFIYDIVFSIRNDMKWKLIKLIPDVSLFVKQKYRKRISVARSDTNFSNPADLINFAL